MIIRIGSKRTIHSYSPLAEDYAYEADVSVRNDDGGALCIGKVRHLHDEQVHLCLGDHLLDIEPINLQGTEPEEMTPEINRLGLPLDAIYHYHVEAAAKRRQRQDARLQAARAS